MCGTTVRTEPKITECAWGRVNLHLWALGPNNFNALERKDAALLHTRLTILILFSLLCVIFFTFDNSLSRSWKVCARNKPLRVSHINSLLR